MNSRAALWQITLSLQQAGLLPEITEEVIEQACTKLRSDPWRGEVISEGNLATEGLHILAVTLTDRWK